MTDRISVVIAEDGILFREGTRRLLEDSGQVDILATVGNADELHEAVRLLKPRTVLTDIRMPPGHHMEGIDAAHTIRACHPGTGIVVMSHHSNEHYAFALLRHGTAGLAYLLKDRVADLDSLIRALREVAAGGSVIDPLVVDALITRQTRTANSPLAQLTERELDVLREMAQGNTNAGIQSALNLEKTTVEKHISSIFAKLGLTHDARHRRVAAVLTFLRDTTG